MRRSMHKKQLVITLSPEATSNYLTRCAELSKAHVESDCLFDGVTLTVDIAPDFFDPCVYLKDEELGAVSIELVEIIKERQP